MRWRSSGAEQRIGPGRLPGRGDVSSVFAETEGGEGLEAAERCIRNVRMVDVESEVCRCLFFSL